MIDKHTRKHEHIDHGISFKRQTHANNNVLHANLKIELRLFAHAPFE